MNLAGAWLPKEYHIKTILIIMINDLCLCCHVTYRIVNMIVITIDNQNNHSNRENTVMPRHPDFPNIHV
jgi:hypothetical protein